MSLFKKDPLGHSIIIKKILTIIIGILFYRKINSPANLSIKGSKNIPHRNTKNILFVSNHQTYFFDAIAIINVLNSTINGNVNSLKNILYLFKPKTNLYYIAAKETMNNNLATRILSYTGSLLIERSWRKNGKNIKRPIKKNDINKVKNGLKNGWVLTFPQGTTKKSSPVRDGTAYLIKENQPLVIPIRINGFSDKFERKTFKIKNKLSNISVTIKKPINIKYENESINSITSKITKSLEL